MSNVIDLSDEATCPTVLLFNHSNDKKTGSGVPFRSYNGLRLYLITDKKNGQYLQMSGITALSEQARCNVEFVFVPDLYQQLEDALRVNIAKWPMLKLKVNKNTQFIWSAYGITQAEEEWVKIVRKVIKDIF